MLRVAVFAFFSHAAASSQTVTGTVHLALEDSLALVDEHGTIYKFENENWTALPLGTGGISVTPRVGLVNKKSVYLFGRYTPFFKCQKTPRLCATIRPFSKGRVRHNNNYAAPQIVSAGRHILQWKNKEAKWDRIYIAPSSPRSLWISEKKQLLVSNAGTLYEFKKGKWRRVSVKRKKGDRFTHVFGSAENSTIAISQKNHVYKIQKSKAVHVGTLPDDAKALGLDSAGTHIIARVSSKELQSFSIKKLKTAPNVFYASKTEISDARQIDNDRWLLTFPQGAQLIGPTFVPLVLKNNTAPNTPPPAPTAAPAH